MSLFPFVGGYGANTSAFDVDLSSNSASGNRMGPGTVQSNVVYIYPAGGTPPYTYTVEYESGDGCDYTVSGNSVQFSTFIELLPSTVQTEFTITVTDSKGAVGFRSGFPVTLSAYLNPYGGPPTERFNSF